MHIKSVNIIVTYYGTTELSIEELIRPCVLYTMYCSYFPCFLQRLTVNVRLSRRDVSLSFSRAGCKSGISCYMGQR